MSEWWTYRPADLLMFSPVTFYRLFELHNAAVWPAQIAALIAGCAILGLILWRPHGAGRTIAALLALAWGFVAWAYFADRYSGINLAAPYFAWIFGAQAALLLLSGTAAGRLIFTAPLGPLQKLGLALLVFALLLQPLIGPLLGRPWTGMEIFGITPDPTVLATLGALVAADRLRWEFLPIPLLWCAVTGATLWTMGSPEALLMPAAVLIALALAVLRGLVKPHRRAPN
ncbi:MAG: DUF6064 family protein [Methyloceanibacter sp.]